MHLRSGDGHLCVYMSLLPPFCMFSKTDHLLHFLDTQRPPTSYVDTPIAQHHTQLLPISLMHNPLEFILVDIVKLEAILKKLSNIFVANLK